jgi:hypothetical protein
LRRGQAWHGVKSKPQPIGATVGDRKNAVKKGSKATKGNNEDRQNRKREKGL